MEQWWVYFAALPVSAYLLGSVPFGLLVGKLKGCDIRKHGSRNIGATNAGRVLGAKYFYIVLALDVAKGLIPVLVCGWMLRKSGKLVSTAQLAQAAWLATGFAAIIGHTFPVYLRFRGGKGVATSLGVVLGIWPYYTLPAAAAVAVWAIVAAVWRYVSLASITAAIAFPAVLAAIIAAVDSWHFARLWPLEAFAATMTVLILLRHRSNIARLLAGTENRIGSKTTAAQTKPPQQKQ